MKTVHLSRISAFLRVILAGVFVTAGISKVVGFSEFHQFLLQLNVASSEWIGLAGQMIIALEICLGVLLLAGRSMPVVAAISLLVMCAFTIFQLMLPTLAGAASACKCFNVPVLEEYERSFAFRIARNAILTAIAMILVACEFQKFRRSKEATGFAPQ